METTHKTRELRSIREWGKSMTKLSAFWSRLERALLSLALLVTAVHSHAQGAPDEKDMEEVLVTGFRAAVESAVEAKRESSTMVDVIKADDIASFPDANLAEAV